MKKTKSLVISQIELAPQQIATLQQKTPEMYVKTRPVKGGRTTKYVEVGYVISQLNAIFGGMNWDFEILEQGKEDRKPDTKAEGEVWAKGKLTIIDHKNGYRVSKNQYGQHPIYPGVALGDAYKSAGSDALKKCASLFGIGLDVMWGQLENENKVKDTKESKEKELTPDEAYQSAKMLIEKCKNSSTLIVIDDKIKESNKFTKAQKVELHGVISAKVDKLYATKN